MNISSSEPMARLICDFTHCGKDAYAFVVWGADKRQQANVCEEHCRAVWDAAEAQIQAGICWWIQLPPRTPEQCDNTDVDVRWPASKED